MSRVAKRDIPPLASANTCSGDRKTASVSGGTILNQREPAWCDECWFESGDYLATGVLADGCPAPGMP